MGEEFSDEDEAVVELVHAKRGRTQRDSRTRAISLSATVATSEEPTFEDVWQDALEGRVRTQTEEDTDPTIMLFCDSNDLMDHPDAVRRMQSDISTRTTAHSARAAAGRGGQKSLVSLTLVDRKLPDRALVDILNAKNLSKLNALATQSFVSFLFNDDEASDEGMSKAMDEMSLLTENFTIYRDSDAKSMDEFLAEATKRQKEHLSYQQVDDCPVLSRAQQDQFMRCATEGEDVCLFAPYKRCQCQRIAVTQMLEETKKQDTKYGFAGVAFPGFTVCILCLRDLAMRIYLDPHNTVAANLYTVKPDYPGEYPSSALMSARCTDTSRVGMFPVINHQACNYAYTKNNDRIIDLIPFPSPDSSMGF